jgi:GNAT superfamily N-acetyltransferase
VTGPLSHLEVSVEPFDAPDAARLVAAAEAELQKRYGPGPHDYLPADPADDDPGARLHRPLTAAEFAPPAGTFLVARVDGLAVGCAGLRPLSEGTAEVKRLYVLDHYRGRGIARRLMDELEAAAPGLGHRHLVLETGGLQPEAIALYDSTGWTRIPPYFGVARHERSVYFEKWLDRAGAG